VAVAGDLGVRVHVDGDEVVYVHGATGAGMP
jgi:hypothetical protein